MFKYRFHIDRRSIWQSVAEIWTNEGVFGLFAGLPARIVGEVSCLVLASSSVYLIQKYMLQKRTNGQLTALVNFVWSSLLYPMQVVATCMVVTGSRLAIGQAPHMPVYRNWMHCYKSLSLSGDSKRGSSLFFRWVVHMCAWGSVFSFDVCVFVCF